MYTIYNTERIGTKRYYLLRNTYSYHKNKNNSHRNIIAIVCSYILHQSSSLLIEYKQIAKYIIKHQCNKLNKNLRSKLTVSKAITEKSKAKYLYNHRYKSCSNKCSHLRNSLKKAVCLTSKNKKFVGKIGKCYSHYYGYNIAYISLNRSKTSK